MMLATKIIDWVGYQFVMFGPLWLTVNVDHAFGRWCIDRAGGWAYRS
jgi:hypothetical protein